MGLRDCPCYLGTEKKAVRCSGLVNCGELRLTFRRREDFEIQLRTFCKGRFGNCEIYNERQKAVKSGDM